MLGPAGVSGQLDTHPDLRQHDLVRVCDPAVRTGRAVAASPALTIGGYVASLERQTGAVQLDQQRTKLLASLGDPIFRSSREPVRDNPLHEACGDEFAQALGQDLVAELRQRRHQV